MEYTYNLEVTTLTVPSMINRFNWYPYRYYVIFFVSINFNPRPKTETISVFRLETKLLNITRERWGDETRHWFSPSTRIINNTRF